jgi:hypothetical protein
MRREDIDSIYRELAKLGVNVEWLRRAGMTDEETAALLTNIKRLIKKSRR